MKKITLWLIRQYRKFSPFTWYFSPIFLIYPECKFYPTCSEYAYESIERYGIWRGTPRIIKRIFRCNPFNR